MVSRSLRTTTRFHRVHNYRRLSSGKYAARPKCGRKLVARRHQVKLTRSQLATEAVALRATRRVSRSPLPTPFRPFIGPTLKADSGSTSTQFAKPSWNARYLAQCRRPRLMVPKPKRSALLPHRRAKCDFQSVRRRDQPSHRLASPRFSRLVPANQACRDRKRGADSPQSRR